MDSLVVAALGGVAAVLLAARRQRSDSMSSAGRSTTTPAGDWLSVRHGELDLARIVAHVTDARAGAIATFTGTTRDSFDGREVVRLEYEGYVPMALREMAAICTDIRTRWPDIVRVGMAHRLGCCPVTEASVHIAISSPHRVSALEAARFAIDTLKGRVPVWKREVYANDDRVWKENREWGGGRTAAGMTPSA
tara:strand:- start:1015 stop:1593 length:579 start_codon:yes stop_codon:yes gene_type:complete